ncbi:MAG: hypothetical protein H0V70_15165 [Ktedonobacteraceae bacterium]|nr:hypothetical protein [Ktedonobacteraceae bacterium]
MQERENGALQAPKDFRRITGAHEILTSFAVAEVLNVLAMLFIGAWGTPLIWWCLQYVGRWFHSSLLFDLGLLLFLIFLLRGFTRQHQVKKIGIVSGPAADVWNIPCAFMALIVFLLVALSVMPWRWMTIPLTIIPTYPLEPFSWPPHPFVPGAWIAAALLFLTHLRILQRYRQQREGLAYSRAHPGSNRTRLIQQAYGFYERGLARFDPPLCSSTSQHPFSTSRKKNCLSVRAWGLLDQWRVTGHFRCPRGSGGKTSQHALTIAGGFCITPRYGALGWDTFA